MRSHHRLHHAPRHGPRGMLLPHVQRQSPAAAHVRRHNHLGPQPCQQTDGGIVDFGIQRLLHTTRHQRHAHFARAKGGEDLRIIVAADGGQGFGHQLKQRLHPRIGNKPRQGAGQARRKNGQTKARGIGHHRHQHRAQQPIHPRAAIGFFDMVAAHFDQMGVIHARGASGRAGQAAKAAVDVFGGFGIGSTARFQHFLDQVDAATGAV